MTDLLARLLTVRDTARAGLAREQPLHVRLRLEDILQEANDLIVEYHRCAHLTAARAGVRKDEAPS